MLYLVGSGAGLEGGSWLNWYFTSKHGPRGLAFPSPALCACVSVSFLSWLWVGPVPLFWTCSHLSWGRGQVSIQSADAQEQVEGLLAENNALRTSLAALEQVQDTWEPLLIFPFPLSLSAFGPHLARVVWTLYSILFLFLLSVAFQLSSPSITAFLAF